MTAAELVKGLSYRLWRRGGLIPEVEITDVVTSAETASKSTVFVHTKTAVRDNYYEMQAAFLKGCRMFVTDREPQLNGRAAVLMVEDAEAMLGELAARVGLDKDDFLSALEQGTYSAQEKAAVEHTRNVLQPRGVPTVYMDGEKISIREYTKEEMVAILTKQAEKSAAPAMVCGDDGCAMQ